MSQLWTQLSTLLCLTAALGGCADREIFDVMPDSAVSARAGSDWPGLAPTSHFDQRQNTNVAAAENSETEAERLRARAARLRARAARLKGPILPRAEQQRLKAATEPI